MTTKLTLSINQETIERARRISRKRGKSISKMIEEYFNSIPENESTKETPYDKIKKILKRKIIDPNIDWKKIKEEYLMKKYGINLNFG